MAETTAGTNPYMMVNLDYKMINMCLRLLKHTQGVYEGISGCD